MLGALPDRSAVELNREAIRRIDCSLVGLCAALEYGEQLAQIAPQDHGLAALIEELRRQAGKPSAQ